MKKMFGIVVLLSLVFSPISMAAGKFWANVVVKKPIAHTTNYGMCGVEVDAPLGNGCNQFIAFDCAGETGSKIAGQKKWEIAQLGLVLGKYLAVYMDSDTTIDGWCVAEFAVLQPTPVP